MMEAVTTLARTPPRCGTNAGYRKHLREDGEVTCQPCLDAHAAHEAGRRKAAGATPRRRGPEHGTRAAYDREWRAWKAGKGPRPCEVCRAANAAATARRRAS